MIEPLFNEKDYLGKDADEVVRLILCLGRFKTVRKVEYGSVITMNHDLSRVRVYH